MASINDPNVSPTSLISTGIEGMDDILYGGLAQNRLYLVEGNTGSGKTTLATQFLLAGAKRGERCLFVTLSESEEEVQNSARSHGCSLEGINVLEIIAGEESLKPDARYTMFHPSEVELTETTKRVLTEVERTKPARLVFDSLSELRLMAQEPLRYRRERTIREFYFDNGIKIGQPVREFQGVLTGSPVFIGTTLERKQDDKQRE